MTYYYYFVNFLFFFAFFSIIYSGLISLVQSEIKRFLAYSSIGHTGFILLGLTSMNFEGYKSSILYIYVYIFTLLSFFIILLCYPNIKFKNIMFNETYLTRYIKYFSDFKYLPFFIQLILSMFLFSMSGFPPFPGFIIKLYIFKSIFFEVFNFFQVVRIFDNLHANFSLIFIFLFIIVIISLLTSYNYIRIISKMIFTSNKFLLYKPISFYTNIFGFSKNIKFFYLFIYFLIFLNIILIFIVARIYNQDMGFFDSCTYSLIHPFFNSNVNNFSIIDQNSVDRIDVNYMNLSNFHKQTFQIAYLEIESYCRFFN